MKKDSIDWFNTTFLIFLPVASVAGLVWYFATETFNPWFILLFTVFYFATGLSITAGYHRLFAHKAYEANPLVEWFFLIFGAAAFENSAFRWCEDHRVHHRFIDQEDDPYSIKKGFFHAHMGWIMQAPNKKDFSKFSRDLAQNPRIAFQHRYFLPIGLLAGAALPGFIGWMMGSVLGGIVFGSVLRITLVHHFTFFINSLCHYWGKQTYSDKDSSKDNPIIAFFTYGEGFHNFHHLFHNDYRNGIRWYHFDPSKWLIRGLAFLGLAENLKTAPKVKILEARLEMQQKHTSEVLQRFPELSESWQEKVEALKLSVAESMQNWQEMKTHYKATYKAFRQRKSQENYELVLQLKSELRLAKREYRRKYSEWKQLIRQFGELEFAALEASASA